MKEVSAVGSLSSARANVVLAALTLLTGSAPEGEVRADTPFRPNVPTGRTALLEAAAAIQTEVSFSITSSDPLIEHAAHEINDALNIQNDPAHLVEAVEETDRQIHEWVMLLEGRGPDLTSIADLLLADGKISMKEIASRLGLPTRSTA